MGVVRRFEDAYNRHDAAAVGACLALDAEGHDPSIPKPMQGREALVAWYRKATTIFPDLKIELVRSTADGLMVAVEYVETSTQKGSFPGRDGKPAQASGKKISHRMCVVYRIEGGLIKEFRIYFDVLGVMAQLGMTG